MIFGSLTEVMAMHTVAGGTARTPPTPDESSKDRAGAGFIAREVCRDRPHSNRSAHPHRVAPVPRHGVLAVVVNCASSHATGSRSIASSMDKLRHRSSTVRKPGPSTDPTKIPITGRARTTKPFDENARHAGESRRAGSELSVKPYRQERTSRPGDQQIT